MQSIYSKETYGTTKGPFCKKEEIKCKSIIKQYKNDQH